MRILGIDPGTVVMGYGVIDTTDDEMTLVDYGVIKPDPKSSIAERLNFLYHKLLLVLVRHQPDAVAIEQPFVAKNVKSAMAVGRAQAIAMLAGANCGAPVYEYTPRQVKQRVSNFGGSDKEQIQEMVRLQLRLDKIPEPADAADALGVAICHLHEMRLKDLLDQTE